MAANMKPLFPAAAKQGESRWIY